MAKVSLQLKFAGRDDPVAVRVPDDIPVDEVVRHIARHFKLPAHDYALRFAVDGKEIELDRARTLFQQGVSAGALLQFIVTPPAAGGDPEAYRETARAMIAALSRLAVKDAPGAENAPRYLSFSNARDVVGQTAALEAFRELVQQLQQRVDKTERSLRDALDELSRVLAVMAEGRADAVLPGSGGSGGSGTGGTGGGRGTGDGGGDEERENERRRDAANQEALREILAVLQNVVRDHDGRADGRGTVEARPSEVRELLEANRRDAEKWGSYAFVCLGAVFGIAVNWVMPARPEISPQSLVAVVIFSIQGGLAYLWSWQAEQRIDAYNAKTKTPKKSTKKSTKKPRPRRPQPAT